MPSKLFSPVIALVVATGLGMPVAEARAGLQLQLSNNGYTQTIDADASKPSQIKYDNDNFNNVFSIEGTSSKSTSLIDGPSIYSQLSVSSFTITNLTGMSQTLTLALSDSGFDPDGSIRPLIIYNSASVTSSQQTTGMLSYQTFAYDGTANFMTSGTGVVATDAVNFNLPISNAGTTTASFTPANAQFSLTSVVTIRLDAYASLVGFNGVSLVHAPEPGTIALALSGVPALALVVLRRRRANRES